MREPTIKWSRWGVAALGLSGLLFTAFPLVRPFYDDLARDPTGAARMISSPLWMVSHLLLIIALVLLPFGLLTVSASLAPSPARGWAFVGTVFGIAGGGLFLPVGGVEAFALPAIARAYLQGQSATLDTIEAARSGLRATVFLPGLVLLGLGGVLTALGVWRSRSLPRWAGIPFALGLACFLPLLPQPIRIIDGLLTGVGALWLTWALWQGDPEPRVLDSTGGLTAHLDSAVNVDTTAHERGQAAVGSTLARHVGELPAGQRASPRMPRFGLPQFTTKRIAVPEHPTITVGGAVAQPCTLTLADLASLPRRDQISDFHCVTTWTKLGVRWSGFRFRDVYDALIGPRARPDAGPEAGSVVVSGLDGMRAGLPVADALADDVLLADTMDGAPLSAEHGAPLRLVAPAHYGYKNIKHVSAIDFVAGDFNRGFTGFAQHARGRVAYEERGRWGPGWLLRYVYRLMIPAGVWLARAEPLQVRQPTHRG